jgi:hypothetical protein
VLTAGWPWANNSGLHAPVSPQIRRLHLASLQGLDGGHWPVHGFVVTHPGGAILVDTSAGGPQHVLDDWRDSLRRMRALGPDRVHFCHHTDIVHR